VKPLLDCSVPHNWGVGAVEIAEAALANRVFELRQASLLFRDGSYAEYPGNATVSSRSFDKDWTDSAQPFDVHIGLKRLSERERNVAVIGVDTNTAALNRRFITPAEPEEMGDLYADGPAAKVRRLTLLLRIFWAAELEHMEDYDTIQVARLVRDGDRVVLAGNFIPPCFALSGSEVLTRLLKDLRDEIAGRSRQLEQYKSPREMRKSEFDASYMVYLLALRSLNRYAPVLFHLTETSRVHPWLVYGVMRQLVGELSSFSERYNLLGESSDGGPALPPYNHENLAQCIVAAKSLVTNLLNDLTVGPEFLARLERDGDIFKANLPKGFFAPRSRYYLVMRTEVPAPDVLEAFQVGAIMAAPSQIGLLTSRALPGIELINMPVAPQGLPRASYSLYFRIESLCQPWSDVEKEGAVALFWADAPEDLQAEIVVLRG
ncbi:MAG: type VI secretion system baseplate subunit TssK, partial [Candidatus Binataceae bacterium]